MNGSWCERKVADVMQRDVVQVPAYLTMGEAAEMLLMHHVQSAPVVDEIGRCVGMLSALDFVRWRRAAHLVDRLGRDEQSHFSRGDQYKLSRDPRLNALQIECDDDACVSVHMSHAMQTISDQATLAEAAQMIVAGGLHHLPVLDESARPVGWLSATDLLAAASEATIAPLSCQSAPCKPR